MNFSRVSLFVFIVIAWITGNTHAQTRIGSSAFSYSAPREYEIGGMTVEGADNLDEGAIRLLSGLAVGDRIEVPGEKTAEAIRKLWKQDLFSDVQLISQRIEGDKIFLVIRVKERPRLSRFKFKGVTKSEADDLREKINLYKEKIVTENLVISTQKSVYNFYAEKGFRAAEVLVTQSPDSVFKNHVLLTIAVDKGKKVKIERIHFEGNRFFSDYKLKRSLKETKEKSSFRPFADLDTFGLSLWHHLWHDHKHIPLVSRNYFLDHVKVRIFKSSKYLEKNLEADKELIVAEYNQKGFRDARILSDTVYPTGPNMVSIDMTISEGHQYYFRNIKWIGNTKYSSDLLTKTLGIKKGDIYDPVKLDARLHMDQSGGDVTSLYMDNGYLFFQLDAVEILVGKDSIDLEVRMYEGSQARIDRVTVSGNTKTNDYVIIRELRTKPGELFSRADIIRSQRELSVLGFFDPEKMNVIPTPDPATSTVDLEYVVEERPNDQLTLQGGYGGGILVATVGVQFNNFSTRNILKPKEWNGPLPSGDGQKLSLNFNTNGRQYQAVNLSFTEPWLGGRKPNSLSLGGFYSFYSDGSKKLTETDSTDLFNVNRQYFQRMGLTAQFGKRLKWPDDYFNIVFEGSAQQYTLQNYSSFFFNTGQAYNLYLKFRIGRSSIDDNIFPSMGSDMFFSGQFTPPYSYFNGKDYTQLELEDKFRFLEYHKWKFSWAHYTALLGRKRSQNLVLYTKIGFGVLGLYNRDVGLVPFERFYLGGDPFSTTGVAFGSIDSREFISLRGYGGNGLSPTIGGTIINKYTMELRYPFSLNPSATVYGLAFAEAGNSWLNFKSFNPLEVYKSAGVGVRIFLPMFGLLGVDWGYRLDSTDDRPEFPAVNDQRSRFHFTLGYQFGDL